MNKILLDTNIILDACIPERPDHDDAIMLLEHTANDAIYAYICALSLKDVYYILCKYDTKHKARDVIEALIEILDIARVDKYTIQEAASSNEPDFEDGIVRACAELYSVNFIISRDVKAFKNSNVQALSAKEFIELYL